MIEILQKRGFRGEPCFKRERRLIGHVFGDTLNSAINIQPEMSGKIYGAKASGTKRRNNLVLVKQ